MVDSNLKKLVWDSQFFSRNIATVVNIDSVIVEQLDEYDLVCKKVDAHNYHLLDQYSALGFKIVEGEILLEKKLELNDIFTPSITQYTANESDIEPLINLAKSSYTSSRFRSPWFDEEQKSDFYSVWIKKAVLGTFDDLCLQLKDGENIQGFISLKKDNLAVSIGLIAVAKNYQGQGIGNQLLKLAEQYALKNRCNKIQVATQTSNLAAINLYIKNNYTVNQSAYWLYRSKIDTNEGNK